MHKTASEALQQIERLVAKREHSAHAVAYSEFPDMDDGPDEGYEKQIQAELDGILDEIAASLTKKYGSAFQAPPPWANLRATGWSVGEGAVFAFLERDDWDTPLSLVVGYAQSTNSDDDPWAYERKDS